MGFHIAHHVFPNEFIMDKADKQDLLQETRRPFKSIDLALSREFKRQGQRKRTIPG